MSDFGCLIVERVKYQVLNNLSGNLLILLCPVALLLATGILILFTHHKTVFLRFQRQTRFTMKTMRFPFLFFMLTMGWSIMLSSCKEKNDIYPPQGWSEYSYTTASIATREISSIFYENGHSIWFGSKDNRGILYNDGYKWNDFNNANTGINFDSISSITRDGNGKYWVGWKSGLASFDGYSWEKTEGFEGLNVTSVVVEGIGDIKAGIKGTSGGIAVLHNNKWEFYSMSNSAIPSKNVNAIASDHDQVLWMATADKGIVKFQNNSWDNISSDIPLISQEFTCITTAPDGSTWAGSSASQLIHFYNNTFTVLNTGTSKPITAIVATDNGNIWCSTFGAGLVKFDGAGWKSFTMENAALPTNDILCLAKDTSGNLFFSIPGGDVLIIKQ